MGVVPRGGGDLWVGFGRMWSLRRIRSVGEIEVGAEGDGVIGVALQCADTREPTFGVRVFQRVGDGLGE